MDERLTQPDSKKKYDPPQLTTISLRPEEAVLGHCKTATGGGMNGSCQQIFGGCPNQGS
jgi:hypothetical protein